jgi:hypothetical protein
MLALVLASPAADASGWLPALKALMICEHDRIASRFFKSGL